MSFINYLEQKKYRPKTIAKYLKCQYYFDGWLQSEELDAALVGYTDVLGYMHYLEQQGKSKYTIHSQLTGVRHYFNYLVSENKRSDNPAAGVFIKGRIRKLPSGSLSMEELELLYQQYGVQLHVEDYKKIILGLLIYQGVAVRELLKIRAKDIKVNEGKIFIKGTYRSNERLLLLHVHQLLSIKQYLDKNKFAEGLFTAKDMTQKIQYMLSQLRQLNKKVITAKQIRSSVIIHWLKQYNLRQVQYMAGHKYVSSTERYQLNHLDDLQTAIQEHHPMN